MSVLCVLAAMFARADRGLSGLAILLMKRACFSPGVFLGVLGGALAAADFVAAAKDAAARLPTEPTIFMSLATAVARLTAPTMASMLAICLSTTGSGPPLISSKMDRYALMHERGDLDTEKLALKVSQDRVRQKSACSRLDTLENSRARLRYMRPTSGKPLPYLCSAAAMVH